MKTREKANQFFDKNRDALCPAFPGEKVYFNAAGKHHLFYKPNRASRNSKESSIRVALLGHALKLLELMPVAQEEDWEEKDGKVINYWAFIGVVDGKRIKVIVRQIGTGPKHYWSVIPCWQRTKQGIRNSKGKLSEI